MVGVAPSMVGVVPGMVGVELSMVGEAPSMVGVVPLPSNASLEQELPQGRGLQGNPLVFLAVF